MYVMADVFLLGFFCIIVETDDEKLGLTPAELAALCCAKDTK